MNSKRLRIMGIVLVILALGSVLLVACARPGSSEANGGGSTPTSTSGGGGSGGCAGTTVHMSASNFVQSCANISKGSKITLVDDVQVLHIIANGMWDSSGNQVTTKEPGAPTVSSVNISGGQADIGPFTTAGTFHIYCSVHVNMNLTVTVK